MLKNSSNSFLHKAHVLVKREKYAYESQRKEREKNEKKNVSPVNSKEDLYLLSLSLNGLVLLINKP